MTPNGTLAKYVLRPSGPPKRSAYVFTVFLRKVSGVNAAGFSLGSVT